MTNLIQVTACGCCECFHRVDFQGDCRDNAERFSTLGEAEKHLGLPVEEVFETFDSESEESIEELEMSPDFKESRLLALRELSELSEELGLDDEMMA